MSKINDGGPAYPLHPGILPDWQGQTGMTLRDYFAAQALLGLLAHTSDDLPTFNGVQTCCKYYADLSYLYADAMLAARAKGGDADG